MDRDRLRQSLLSSAQFTFARSGGPGGQNVNKVNTKVFCTIDITSLDGLTPEEKEHCLSRLSNRLDSDNNLVISCDEERTQLRNREIALARIENLITAASRPDKKRIPTRPGRAAKLKRLLTKKTRSTIKNTRKTPHTDE